MKIFLTGSEGFIGSHIAENLLKKKYKLKCLYQYNSFNNKGWLSQLDKKLLKNCDLVSGDVKDYNLILDEIKGCDIVIHLAALIAIPYSYKAVNSYLENNVNGTINILEACKKRGVKKIICTSTSEVYGTGKQILMNENHNLVGQSPYAASKIAADQFAISYYHSFKLPVTILRPFNTFGPRQSLRAIIPSIINQALSKSKYLEIGSIFPSRDFNFINDISSAFEKCIHTKKDIGEIINIGSGNEITINYLAKTIYKLIGKKLLIKKSKKRTRPLSSEVFRLRANNSKAKKLLGWSPKYANHKNFCQALAETIDWYKNQKNKKFFEDNKYTI